MSGIYSAGRYKINTKKDHEGSSYLKQFHRNGNFHDPVEVMQIDFDEMQDLVYILNRALEYQK